MGRYFETVARCLSLVHFAADRKVWKKPQPTSLNGRENTGPQSAPASTTNLLNDAQPTLPSGGFRQSLCRLAEHEMARFMGEMAPIFAGKRQSRAGTTQGN